MIGLSKKKKAKKDQKHEESQSVPLRITVKLSIRIWMFLMIILLLAIYIYAKEHHCRSVFWECIGNYFEGFSGEFIFTIIGSGVGAGVSMKNLEENKKCLPLFLKRWGGLVIFLYSGFITMGSFFRVQAAICKQEEAVVEISKTEEGELIYQIPYDVDQDPFMENHSLEEYYGIEVQENENIEAMVKILHNNKENNRLEKREVTVAYNRYIEAADVEYEMAQVMVEEYENTGNEIFFEDCMDLGIKAVHNRECADEECEKLSNERPIAAGYKELGDKYVGKGNSEKAFSMYQCSAKWYIRVICHGISDKDKEEVTECIKQFKKLGVEISKIEVQDQEDKDRKEKILDLLEVYNIYVNDFLYCN